jgi:hypothetical protein
MAYFDAIKHFPCDNFDERYQDDLRASKRTEK